MLKKLFITAVAVVVGLFVVRKTELGSLVHVWWKDATTCARKQVPLETEVQRLREEIGRLGKDSVQHYDAIAEERVGVRKLASEVKDLRANLEKQERNIRMMRSDLESGKDLISYGDNQYPRKQVEKQLKLDWASFQRGEGELKAKEQLLEARREALNSAEEQLNAIQDKRQEMEVELARLEAELKKVRVAQTRSKFHIDTTPVSRVKEGIAALEERINVERERLNYQGEVANGRIDPGAKSSKDVLKEIDNRFSKTENRKVAVKE